MTAPNRSVTEWLRHIQIEWQLQLPQLAQLLHVECSALEKLFSSASTKILGSTTESDPVPTIPPGFDSAAPLIQIYRKLAVRYPETADQVKWLFTEHRDFGGTKPIEVASSSIENLFWLGYYLDSLKPSENA